MEQTRPPEETFAIIAGFSERGTAWLLRDMEPGETFTVHPKDCLLHSLGVCTCEPIISQPMAEA